MKFVKSVSLTLQNIRYIEKCMDEFEMDFSKTVNELILQQIRFKKIAFEMQKNRK